MSVAVATSETMAEQNQVQPIGKPINYAWLASSLRTRRIYHSLGEAAATEANLLIVGAEAVDRETIARAIHSRSGRRVRRFVGLNCGALPLDLIDSELFGFECAGPGGAIIEHNGLLREAEGGTVFLDEITEMSLESQDNLWRAIGRRVFRPIGAAREQTLDVRIIAATSHEPSRAIAEGRLYQELYYVLRPHQVAHGRLREAAENVAFV